MHSPQNLVLSRNNTPLFVLSPQELQRSYSELQDVGRRNQRDAKSRCQAKLKFNLAGREGPAPGAKYPLLTAYILYRF